MANFSGHSPHEIDFQESNRQIANQLLKQWQQVRDGSTPVGGSLPEMDFVLGLQRMEVLLEEHVPASLQAFHALEENLLDVLGEESGLESTPIGRSAVAGLDDLLKKGGRPTRFKDLCRSEQGGGSLGQDPVYMFRHLGEHLFASGLHPALFDLLEEPDWSKAQYRQLGSHSGYLADLQRGTQAAGQLGGRGLPLLMHYCLLAALVQGASGEVGADALVAQAEAGDLQPALDRAELIRDPGKKIEAWLGIAETAANRKFTGMAERVLRGVSETIPQVSQAEIQAKAWFDVAAIRAKLGETQAASNDIARGLALLPPLTPFTGHPTTLPGAFADLAGSSNQNKPVQFTTSSGQRIDSDWVARQTNAMQDHYGGLAFGRSVAAYCGAVIAYARLGQKNNASAVLNQLKNVMHQSDFSSNAVQALAICAVKLAGLEALDLGMQAIAANGHRSDRPSFLPTLKLKFEFTPDQPVSDPFGLPSLLDAAKRLTQMGHPDLAVAMLQKIGGNADFVRNEAIVEVVEQTEDPHLLSGLVRNPVIVANRAARKALVVKIARQGDIESAEELAGNQPTALAALAATLLSVRNPGGQVILNRVMQNASGRPNDGKRREAYLLIVKNLAEADCCDQALTVWREVKDSAIGENRPKTEISTRAALAACLVRKARLNEGLALAEECRNVLDRNAVTVAVARALYATGQRPQAIPFFEKALQTAENLRSRDDKIAVLDDLLDELLAVHEFDLAWRVAKKLDRAWMVDSVIDEPGLLFKMAKDRLARAVGRPADEDLAIDISPDNQVKVIQAMAESGDYHLAKKYAEKIDNVAVQEDMLESVAEAARQAGDLETAFQVLDGLEEDSYLLDELRTQVAEEGVVGGRTSAGSHFRFAILFVNFALDLQRASRDQQNAEEWMGLYVDTCCELLYDPDDDSRRIGLWALNVFNQILAQTGYLAGHKVISSHLHAVKGKVRQAKEVDEWEKAVQNAAFILAGAGSMQQVSALIADLIEPVDQARSAGQVWCYLAFASGPAVVPGATQFLAKLDLEETYRKALLGEIWAAAALGQADRKDFTQAWQTVERIGRRDIHKGVCQLLAYLQATRPGATPHQGGFSAPEELKALPTLLLALFMRSLVRLRAGEVGRSLLASLPGQPISQQPAKRESSWWWEPLDDQTRQISEDLCRHGQPAQDTLERREVLALALAQAMCTLGCQQRDSHIPNWLLELIENELNGSRKVGGVTALANWMALVFSHAQASVIELSIEALGLASRGGLWNAMFTVAGLAPLLSAAGGSEMLDEMRRRLQTIREGWIASLESS